MQTKNLITKYTYISLIILFTVILDQTTKLYVIKHLSLSQNLEIIRPILNIQLIFNRGISFGMMDKINNANTFFLLINTIITVIICYIAFKNTSLALALIVGGALGNLIDRFKIGAVIDFIELDIKIFYIGIFNIADIAITVGCMLVLVYNFMNSNNEKNIQ